MQDFEKFPSDYEITPLDVGFLNDQLYLHRRERLVNESLYYQDYNYEEKILLTLLEAGVELTTLLELRQAGDEKLNMVEIKTKLCEISRYLPEGVQDHNAAEDGDAIIKSLTAHRFFESALDRVRNQVDNIEKLRDLLFDEELRQEYQNEFGPFRKKAEALIISSNSIPLHEKNKWLLAIATIFNGEGLDFDDPATLEFIEQEKLRQRREGQSLDESMDNFIKLAEAFDDCIKILNIPLHDDLEMLGNMLERALGTIKVSFKDQDEIRANTLLLAEQKAKEIGWSDELFNFVIGKLRTTLEQ